METTDESYISRIKENNCSESLKKLSDRHAGLAVKICSYYSNQFSNSGVFIDNPANNRDAILYEAVKDFDPSKNIKFNTWYGQKLKFYCLDMITEEIQFYRCEESEMVKIQENSQKEIKDYSSDIEYIFDIIKQMSDKRVKQIFKMRYYNGERKNLSWKVIAAKLNMSIQGVINLHNETVKKIKNKLESNSICDIL